MSDYCGIFLDLGVQILNSVYNKDFEFIQDMYKQTKSTEDINKNELAGEQNWTPENMFSAIGEVEEQTSTQIQTELMPQQPDNLDIDITMNNTIMHILNSHPENNLKSLGAYEEEDDECIWCADTGRTKEDPFFCKNCGKKYNELSGTLSAVDVSGIYIPKDYRNDNNLFDKDKALVDLREKHNMGNDKYITAWLGALELSLQRIRSNQLKGAQVFICSQPQLEYLNYKWVYTCITEAVIAGYKTTCLLNPITIDVRKFINIDDDILFFELVTLDYEESMNKLEYICKYRMHKDKPTFVITTVDVNTLDKAYPISSNKGVITNFCNYSHRKDMRLLK